MSRTHPWISVQTVSHLTCFMTRRSVSQNTIEDLGRCRRARKYAAKAYQNPAGLYSTHFCERPNNND